MQPTMLSGNHSEYYQGVIASRCDSNIDFMFWIIDGSIGFFILAGNLFACVVFMSCETLRHNFMNTYLFSLGVSDILVAVLVIPGYAAFCTGCRYLPGSKYCYIFESCKDYALLSSLFSLAGITFDRYLAVLKPLKYSTTMTRRTVVWILSLIWSCPFLLASVRYIWLASSQFKSFLSQINQIYSMCLTTIFVFTPIIVVGVVNFRILKAINRQRAKTQGASKHSKQKHKIRVQKGTMSCILVVIIFVVSWVPRAFYTICALFKMQSFLSPLFAKLSLLFLFMQSAINPLIYSFMRVEFRRAAKRLLCKLNHGS